MTYKSFSVISIAVISVLACTLLVAQTSTEIESQNATSVSNSSRIEKFVSNSGRTSLLKQSELDGLIDSRGGGACPTTAAINTYQLIRVLNGLEADSNLYRVAIQELSTDASLLEGRLSNKQVVDLVQRLSRRLNGIEISVNVVSAPNSAYAIAGSRWDKDFVFNPGCTERRICVVSFTVEENDEVLGRHFVTGVSCSENELQVLDPSVPTKLHKYRIERRTDFCDRIFLRYPPEVSVKGRSLEVNTIFEISYRAKQAGGLSTPTESTPVATVIADVDRLATKLSNEGQLKSPNRWREEGAKFGIPALDLPAELGGANWPATKMIEVFRHAGRIDLNLRDVVGGAHSRVLLRSNATEVRDILQLMADGKGYMAITITEPNSGSDFTAMETTSRKVEGGYILNGLKRFNARLEQASHVVIFTGSNTGKPGRLNVFVVPVKSQGVKVETFGAHGLTGNSYGGLELKDVFVPDALRIGNEDDGYDIFNSHFRYWRLMQSAAAIGTAERALEMMAKRLETRKVYGQPIGRFTHLQQPLGQHSTELKMAWALAREAAKLIDEKRYDEADELVCGLKAEGVEIALKAVDAAARAFGGEGYSDLVDIGDRLRDLNGLRIADGTTDVMRSAVVKSRFGKQFWEMAFKPAASPEKQSDK